MSKIKKQPIQHCYPNEIFSLVLKKEYSMKKGRLEAFSDGVIVYMDAVRRYKKVRLCLVFSKPVRK